MWGIQSPDEKLDWRNDWSDWLNVNDGVESSVWSISPGEVELSGDLIETSANITTVIVSGLELGKSYQLKNIVTTYDGLIGERDITIRCQYP